ncbi:MAG: response regulator, partial [Verrucomicrobia bacterium]
MKRSARARKIPVAAEADETSPFGLSVSKVRHDLRNSIGHVLGFADLLLEDAQESGRAAARSDLELIVRAANRVTTQVNATLDARKIKTVPASVSALQSLITKSAGEIISATQRIAQLPGADGDAVFQDDLARIAGAARHALESAQSALSNLVAPAGESDTAFFRVLPPVIDWSPVRMKAAAVKPSRTGGVILVVDDLEENREMLSRRLSKLGYSVELAENGERALEFVAGRAVDLILLDIMMPGLNGVEVLQRLKANPATQHIPVVMLSSTDQADTVVNCIQSGADDFLPKPFNPTLLMARIDASLAKKRLHDQEAAFTQRLQAEQEISQRLLLNILPQPIAERLKQGEAVIADGFAEVTVLFTDFVGFTKFSSHTPPTELVGQLNDIFSAFDELCERHGLEKIKMIGDGYMVAGGVPVPRADHAEAVAALALDMQREVATRRAAGGPFQMRVGIHSGPVVAGVIGRKKFAYDLWGDTVNLASRMESCAPTGGILVTSATRKLLKNKFRFKPGRILRVKGRGRLVTYQLLDRA